MAGSTRSRAVGLCERGAATLYQDESPKEIHVGQEGWRSCSTKEECIIINEVMTYEACRPKRYKAH